MADEIQICRDSDGLAKALALHVLRLAAEAVAARGTFAIALSGGSALSRLAEGLLSDGAPACPAGMAAWQVFWADERCVPNDSPECNSAVARRALLDRLPIPAGQIHAVEGTLGPSAAAKEYQSRLAKVLGVGGDDWPRFDLILLGVGPDGHTASLFPGQSTLDEAARWVVPVFDAPKPPPERVSLTLPLIHHARQVAFVAAGADKAPALAQILGGRESSQDMLPAARVRLAQGGIHWFIDQAAADAMHNKGTP